MSASLRFCGISLPLVCCLVSVVLSHPECLEQLGVEVASDSLGRQQPRGERVAEPDPRIAIVVARRKAREQITTRLIEGQLSLFEAAVLFRDLSTDPPQYPEYWHRRLPGNSEEEQLCRHVILWAKSRKAAKASESEAELFGARLDTELATRLRCDGRIELPARR